MSILDFIKGIFHQAPQASNAPRTMPTQQPMMNQHPNFVFTPNDKGGQTFYGTAPPVPTPKAFLPQNIDPLAGLSVYGDSSGNQWYENDETGQRYTLPSPQTPLDYQLPSNNTLYPGQSGYPGVLPVQHLDPKIKLMQQAYRSLI